MASEPARRARVPWAILSLVLSVTFGHTTACRGWPFHSPGSGSEGPGLADMLSRLLRVALTGGVLLAIVIGVVSGEDDLETLAQLYRSLEGGLWTNNSGWASAKEPMGNWYGVDANSTHVNGLDLSANNLAGKFPDLDDGVLPGLKRLILDNNDISGEIPTWIGSLPELGNLDLYNNALEGEIPPELGQATSLTHLNLGKNTLEGSIPSELGNLVNLTFLKLNDNNLEGIVPDDVWGLSLMSTLDLGVNGLEGMISSKIGLMKKLSWLDLNFNSFSGEIPDELGDLAAEGGMETVDLRFNYFSGSVPYGLDDSNIEENLYLSGNNLDDGDSQRTDGATAAPYSTPAPMELPSTPHPTMSPTPQPTMSPTSQPTMFPTPQPTVSPTPIPVPPKPSASSTPLFSASPTSSGAPSMPPPMSLGIAQTGGEPTDETPMIAAVAVSAVVVLFLAGGLAYRKFRSFHSWRKSTEVDGPCKKPSTSVSFPPRVKPAVLCFTTTHSSGSGETEIDDESGLSCPEVLGPGNPNPLPPRTVAPSPTVLQPSTQHPSMNENRPGALVDDRGSQDNDPVSGREETKLGTTERRGGLTSAGSPSTFGNTVNQILYATRVTARAAQSSSYPIVPEYCRMILPNDGFLEKKVAVLVETLVGLAEDSGTNPEIFKKSNELCRWLKVVLERADQLLGLDADPSGVSDLLQRVKGSVESLVGVMKAYQNGGKLSQVLMASVYRKRHADAEEAVRVMLQYFQVHLTVQVAHHQAHEQERSRKEIVQLKEVVTEWISKIDPDPHARRPKADSVGERRAKLLDKMEIAEEDIEISENVLGEGVSGKVYFADCCGLNAAAKVMELEGDRNDKKQRNAFLNELQHMRRLASAHTVEVFGVVTSVPRKLILVMELMPGGDLFLYIRKKRQENQTIPEKAARRLIEDVAAGMDFLHSNNTWHGDLKSLNVLLDASDRAKISDFGTSHWTEQTRSKSVQSNWVTSGTTWFDTLTFHWAAPEVLSASEEQQLARQRARTTTVVASSRPTTGLSFKSDVYSFAIIAWEILSSKVPWDDLSGQEIFRLVCLNNGRPRIPEGAPADLADMVRRCWDSFPERRPTSRQILDHLGRNRREEESLSRGPHC